MSKEKCLLIASIKEWNESLSAFYFANDIHENMNLHKH